MRKHLLYLLKVGGGQEESVEKITETAETFCDDVKAATEDRSKLGEANKAIESPAQPQEQRQRKKRAKHEQVISSICFFCTRGKGSVVM